MRKFRLLQALGLITILAATGCGGSGGSNHSVPIEGAWVGTFSDDTVRLANFTSGELAILYTREGSAVGGQAILTVDTGGGPASYRGGVSGTFTSNGSVDATIHFDPALPGDVSDVQVVGRVSNGTFTGTYSAGTEVGTITQTRYTGQFPLTAGTTYGGSLTASGGEPETISLTVGEVNGNEVTGTFTDQGLSSTFEGVVIGNRLIFNAVLDVTIHVEFSSIATGNTINGTFHSQSGEIENHGVFTLTKAVPG